MEVVSVTSELYPLVKTGGLADVAGALPGALASEGVRMRTLVPGYPAVTAALETAEIVLDMPDYFGGTARLLSGEAKGLSLFVLDAPHLFLRPGSPYLGTDGRDWPDNARRFAALSYAAYELARGAVAGYRPAIVHGHDWQAGLVPAYIAYNAPTGVKTVHTVHNIAFQGQFGWDIFHDLRMDFRAASDGAIEYFGGIGYLKSALQNADAITTVSPTYAREIMTPEYGMGLEGLLRSRSGDLHGIINGIDIDAWNPATDPALRQVYDATAIEGRAANAAALRERFRLDHTPGPLFAVVSRLTWQKGMDMLLEAVDGLVMQGATLCVLGSGDPVLEAGFADAALRYPGRVGFVRGYDEQLSHLIQGGADVMLVPSRFEPCGLTQLYGLRYGCVPLVARVGGLADTVIDANLAAVEAGVATGIVFSPATAEALSDAITRTIGLHRDQKIWQKIQRRGMVSDVSWATSARHYADLYRRLLGLEAHEHTQD
ncbi:glycogen synthase GlgA [Devosia enhydra]|uniref:glycogen synthase GlgA n=1 Tax=Devosia enhydra TaxID=665118 RepID=UPI000931B714|nr:glycogen synthase GlgA [Devosia enhydra]